jgi:hypothetical protein
MFITIILLFQFVGTKLPTVAGVPTSLAIILCVVFLFFQRGLNPSQCPDTHFPQSNRNPNHLLCDFQLSGLPEGLAECCPATQTWLLSPVLSSDAVAGCPLAPQMQLLPSLFQ